MARELPRVRAATEPGFSHRVTLPSDDRAALARAYHWAARGMTIAVGMVVPGAAGIFLDKKLGTKVLFTILGCAFGMVFGIWQLVGWTRQST